jgi:hypothetical protein
MPSDDASAVAADVICADPNHYAPFCRLETKNQTSADAVKQQSSMEVWGKSGIWGTLPAVRAYRRSLKDGERGVEFATPIKPNPGGTPYEAKWYETTPGAVRMPNGFVAISICCFRNRQP